MLAAIPYSTLALPGVFDGAFNSAGVQQLIAICLVFGGLAISYDLLFGHTGILSFGHGMFVAIGMYATTILVNHAGYGLWTSAALGLGIGLVAAVALGAVAMRVSGIGFAMVTLAFGQAVSILIVSGSPRLTGGEQGQALRDDAIPAFLAGVRNTGNLYWIALIYLVVCALVVWAVAASVPGRVMRAIRDNEQRVEVLGLNPYLFKLLAFVVAGRARDRRRRHLPAAARRRHGRPCRPPTSRWRCWSWWCWAAPAGGGARSSAASSTRTRARSLTRVSSSSTVASLPGVVRGPLAQPLFLLGLAFVIIVIFVPGGLAGLPARLRPDADSEGPVVARFETFEEYTVPVDGGDLAVLRWPADRADAPTVLLVHGITANALAWAGVVEAVGGRVHLLAPDLRGRAGSRDDRRAVGDRPGRRRPRGRARSRRARSRHRRRSLARRLRGLRAGSAASVAGGSRGRGGRWARFPGARRVSTRTRSSTRSSGRRWRSSR